MYCSFELIYFFFYYYILSLLSLLFPLKIKKKGLHISYIRESNELFTPFPVHNYLFKASTSNPEKRNIPTTVSEQVIVH